MAFSNPNQATVAFKNLFNKSNTDVNKGLGNEAEGIFFNIPGSAVWTSTISTTPATAVAAGVTVLVTANMVLDGTSNGHAFFATWPVSAPAGTDPTTSNPYAYGLGLLTGIASGDRVRASIPTAFGVGYEAKPFDTGSNAISVGDVRNWIFQYNSGIFFQQDNLGLNPGTIQLYPYLGTTSSSGGGSSGFSGYSGSGAGASGFSGVSGYSAFSGVSGYSGVSAFSGVSGYSAFSGTSGFSGVSGFSGIGTSGFSGASGYSAFSGVSGYSGTSGFSGVGTSGFSGYSGASGPNHWGLKNVVEAIDVINVESDFQYLIYENLNILGEIDNSGEVVILDGDLILTGGGVLHNIGTGTLNIVDDTEAGTSGVSGFSGVSGYSGISGRSGFSGVSAFSGISGYSGVSAFSGVSGFSGVSAFSGVSGYSGVSAFSGVSGFSGNSTSGFSGYSGVSGYSGISGYSGVSGYSAFSGVSGFSGQSGPPNWGLKNIIEPSDVINVQVDFQYLIFDNLEVQGTLNNSGDVTIMNGALDLVGGGAFNNTGTLNLVDLLTGPEKKYSQIFMSIATVPYTITHNLGTTEFTFSIWENTGGSPATYNTEIDAQVDIIDDDNITVTTTSNVDGKIFIRA